MTVLGYKLISCMFNRLPRKLNETQMNRRQPSSLFVVGANLNLANPWQINRNRETPIKAKQQQQRRSQTSQPTPPQASVKQTPERDVSAATEADLLGETSPAAEHQSALVGSWKMKSSGKRVSVVDPRDSVEVDTAPPVLVSQVLRSSSSTAGTASKKKPPRHISQLNSSESVITSTGTRTSTSTREEDHQGPRQPRKRGNANTSKHRHGGREREKTFPLARNKKCHLFGKLIQRQILQIPRLNLLPSNSRS